MGVEEPSDYAWLLGIFFRDVIMTLLICTVVIYVVILVFGAKAGIEIYLENREFSRRFSKHLEHANENGLASDKHR